MGLLLKPSIYAPAPESLKEMIIENDYNIETRSQGIS